MKKLITNYTFNAGAKTVTFSDYGSITLENVLVVTNVTANVIIYNFAQPAKGGSVAGNVLTLTYNTGSMSNGDKLQIYYDDPTYVPSLAAGSATSANQTNGTQQTRITDGTNTVSVIAGDSGQNAQVIATSRKEVTFSTTTAQAVASTDAGNYRWVSVHVTSQGTSSSVTFQTSNDNTNWGTAALVSSSSTVNVATTVTTSTAVYQGPLAGRYFRLNVTGITAGTTAGVIEFYSLPSQMNTLGMQVAQSGTWTVGSSTATGSATPANAFLGGMSDTTNLVSLRAASAVGDGISSGASVLVTSDYIWNGGTFDRPRSASSASGTTGTGVPAAGIMGFDGTNYQRVKVDSGGNLSTAAYQATDTIYSGSTALTPKFATITASASGATTVVALVASKRIRVLSYTLVANGTVNVKFQSSTTSDITGLLYLAASTGASVSYSPVGLFQTVAGEALSINLSGAVAVGGHLVYVEV